MSWLYVLIVIVLLAGVGLLALLATQSGSSRRPGSAVAQPASWKSVPLLNNAERKLHAALSALIPQIFGPDAHLLTQVSLGEFLKGSDRSAFNRINAKRADFVVTDPSFNVLAVIEYQGAGHNGNGAAARASAAKRDDTKREALTSAGIRMIEIQARWTESDLRNQLQHPLAAVQRSGRNVRINNRISQ